MIRLKFFFVLTLTSDSIKAFTMKSSIWSGAVIIILFLAALEATLENNNDENRALRKRCLDFEAEVERLREKANELRRKYDDTQAALHELGRENQSLQVCTSPCHPLL